MKTRADRELAFDQIEAIAAELQSQGILEVLDEGLYRIGEVVDQNREGINVAIFACMHGDEVVGIYVIQEILRLLNGIREIFNVSAGSLTFGVANPKAFIEGKRFVGEDLNRCFDRKPNQVTETDEGKRVFSLEKILRTIHVLFDLHAAIMPVKPHVIAPKIDGKYLKLLKILGYQTLVHGQGIWPSPDAEGRVQATDSDIFVVDHGAHGKGGFGITIEAGWLKEVQPDHLVNAIIACLVDLGLFNCEPPAIQLVDEFEQIKAVERITAGPYFEWKLPTIGNFMPVDAGTVIAINNGLELKYDHEIVLLFPKKQETIHEGMNVAIICMEG
jgi:succinylglutamate desuccinylase